MNINLGMLRFNDEIYFSDNIIRCFLLWMKYQSSRIEFLNSQCFHGDEILEITENLKSKTYNNLPKLIFIPYHIGVNEKLKIIRDNFTKYKLILIPHQLGVHWWINIFVKLKNDSYSLDESYFLVTLNRRNQNNELQVKNILKYFDDVKHINVEHISLTNIPKEKDDYSCGAFVYLYSYYASSKINEDLPKDEWCDKLCSITATYDIQDSEML